MTPSAVLGKNKRPYCNRIAHFLVVAFVFCCAATAAWAGPNVLLLWDDDESSVTNHPPQPSELDENTQSLITALEDAGIAVTLSDHTQSLYNGLLPAPDSFDAVIHLNGNTTDSIAHMPTSTVAKLVNYVQNLGGGIITEENTASQIAIPIVSIALSSLMNDLMTLKVQAGAPPAFGTMTLTAVPGEENHPLLRGLPNPISFVGGRMRSEVQSYASDSATLILQDETGLPAAAVRDYGSGRVVSFHHKGNFRSQGNFSTTLQEPNAQQLFVNAVLWCDQHAPTPVSIVREKAGPAGASGAPFIVNFSEGVKGLGSDDFQIVASPGLTFSATPTITPLSDRQYRVTVIGLGGTGTLGLNLLDDDSVTDVSFAENPLGGVGSGNGALTGEVYSVDAVPPVVDLFGANPQIIPLGDRAQFTVHFSEPMDTAFSPTIDVVTDAQAIIHASPSVAPPDNRVKTGLLALYTFDEGAGDTVHDLSNNGTALDLAIAAAANVSWVEGGLSINASTVLLTTGPASKIISGCQANNEITIEAWLRPANNTQAGPARIATLSAGLNTRDLTLEQNGADLDVRLRTTVNSTNGVPELTASATVDTANLEHVVFTRDAAGNATIYKNNTSAASTNIGGDFSTWATNYKFAVGNELSQNRAWQGEIYLLAVYDRALSAAEVNQNFSAGPVTVLPGDGAWTNSTTYQVSMDRTVVPTDQGGAMVEIQGARDPAGNPMAPATDNIGIISSTLLIVQQPGANYTREVGASFEFDVAVTGAIGGVQYQWFKQSAAKSFLPVGANAPVLAFPSLEFTDAGDYYCAISDTQDSVQTSASHLDVAAQLPVGGVTLVAIFSAIAAVALCKREAPPARAVCRGTHPEKKDR